MKVKVTFEKNLQVEYALGKNYELKLIDGIYQFGNELAINSAKILSIETIK